MSSQRLHVDCTQAAKCASKNILDDSWDLSSCQPPNHPLTCKDGLFSTLGCQVCRWWVHHQVLREHLAVVQGAPVYGSAPHFLSGASELSSNRTIKGLKPSRELHTTFLNVEPLSGVAFQVIEMIMIMMGIGKQFISGKLFDKCMKFSKLWNCIFKSYPKAVRHIFTQAHKRIQISFPLEPISQISILAKVKLL